MLANGLLRDSLKSIMLVAVSVATSESSASPQDRSVAALLPTGAAECPDIVISPKDAPTGGYFGSAVAVTPDSSRLVAGILYFDGSAGPDSGAVWVFEKQGNAFVETMLQPSDGAPYDYFGRAVAISDDGRFIAVGAPLDNTTTVDSGSVRIFVSDGFGSWLEQATLIANEPRQNADFGFAVALSDDGSRIVIGARREDQPISLHGAAYVYRRDGEQWSLEAELNPELPAEVAEFGYSVAISSPGDRVVVGAPSAFESNGAAIVFDRTGSTWERRQTFAGKHDGAYLGRSVDISADGETVLIGAVGAAFVAKHADQEWAPPELLTSCNPSGFFGHSVSISAQGDLAMIGAPGQHLGGMPVGAGAVHVYGLESGTWRRIAQLVPRQIHSDVEMGRCLDFASLTGQLFAGAPRYRISGEPRGAILQLDPSIACFGDFDGNQAIDIDDLLALISAWGPCGKGACPADLDLDGMVESDDLLIMIDVWSCLGAN